MICTPGGGGGVLRKTLGGSHSFQREQRGKQSSLTENKEMTIENCLSIKGGGVIRVIRIQQSLRGDQLNFTIV